MERLDTLLSSILERECLIPSVEWYAQFCSLTLSLADCSLLAQLYSFESPGKQIPSQLIQTRKNGLHYYRLLQGQVSSRCFFLFCIHRADRSIPYSASSPDSRYVVRNPYRLFRSPRSRDSSSQDAKLQNWRRTSRPRRYCC